MRRRRRYCVVLSTLLEVYHKRTKFLTFPTKRRPFLFLLGKLKSDITSTTISRWFLTLIIAAFSGSVGNGDERFRAHEFRAWVSSLAWHNSTSLLDSIEAAFWSSPALFLEFYLRDVLHTFKMVPKASPSGQSTNHHLHHQVQGTKVSKTLGKPASLGLGFCIRDCMVSM